MNKEYLKELSIGVFMILCASLIAHYAIIKIDERKGNILKTNKTVNEVVIEEQT